MIINELPDHLPGIRLHPYEPGGRDPRVQWYDFRSHPEEIPVSLEDFRPWEHYEAVPKFYGLLRWLNGPDSIFESNDCGFAVRAGPGFDIGAPVVAGGRIMFFLRSLSDNRSSLKLGFLKGLLFESIREADPKFTGGHVDFSTTFSCFTALPGTDEEKVGFEQVIEFYAHGETEPEAMDNLRRLFTGLDAALRRTSAGFVAMGLAEPPNR
jgi:hypothetical protein